MDRLPLFPLGNALFPDGLLHLRVFEVRYLDMVRQCQADGTPFGVVILLDGREVRRPDGQDVLADVGTLARIDACDTLMPGVLAVRCTGLTRFQLADTEIGKYGLWTGVPTVIENDAAQDIPDELQGCADALGRFIARLQRESLPAERWPLAPPFRLDECGWVADRWAELLPLPAGDKRDLLAETDPQVRLARIDERLRAQGLLQ